MGAPEGQLWCKVLICDISETFKALKTLNKHHMRRKTPETFPTLDLKQSRDSSQKKKKEKKAACWQAGLDIFSELSIRNCQLSTCVKYFWPSRSLFTSTFRFHCSNILERLFHQCLCNPKFKIVRTQNAMMCKSHKLNILFTVEHRKHIKCLSLSF